MLLLYCTATLLSRLLNEANGSAGPSSEALSVNQSITFLSLGPNRAVNININSYGPYMQKADVDSRRSLA